jgi:hypothetical protein
MGKARDAWNKAYKAVNYFDRISFTEGRAESDFLLGIIKQNDNAASGVKSEGMLDHSHFKHSTSDLTLLHLAPDEPHLSKSFSSHQMLVTEFFKTARQKFVEVNNEFGLARVSFAIALSDLENLYMVTNHDTEHHLELAERTFAKWHDYSSQVLCLVKMAELMLQTDNCGRAKDCGEKALEISIQREDKTTEGHCRSIIGRVNEKIRAASLNVFIFLKAWPILDSESQENLGPMTRVSNTFKIDVMRAISQTHKIVQVKFDTLTRKTLQQLKTSGCRVLQLSSDVWQDDCLCVEGRFGELEKISLEELQQILIPHGERLAIDVVVLAIPRSRMLAEIFIALGVPHVVCFDFSDSFMNLSYCDFENHVYSAMYEFCQDFYDHLVNEVSVERSCELARDTMKEHIRHANKSMKICNLREDMIGDGPMLLPEEEEFGHSHTLYGKDNWSSTILKDGTLADMSKIRGPTNVAKPGGSFTSRQFEMHKCCRYTHEYSVVNVFDIKGVGKTRFIQETAYFLNV